MLLKFKSRAYLVIIILVVYFNFLLYQQGMAAYANVCDNFRKGEITDSVPCKENKEFNYALYLPVNYSDTVKWPVIYVFDAAAKGAHALSYYKQGAEKYGYILIGSNNSRNGMVWDKYYEIADYLFDDTNDRFSIDTNRIYTSGISGGSRVASLVAMDKHVAGVIGCAAGFPLHHPRSAKIPDFVYLGLIGKRDGNYLEMFDLEQKLKANGNRVVIRAYDYGHDWPSPSILVDAIEWINLQAMNKGTIEKNSSFIDGQFAKEIYQARTYLQLGEYLESYKWYCSITEDFACHPGILKIQITKDSLERSKGYKKDLRKWDKARIEELEFMKKMIGALNNIVFAEHINDSVRSLCNNRVRILKKQEKSKNAYKNIRASRLLSFLILNLYVEGENYTSAALYSKAIFIYELWKIAQPDNKYLLYTLARVYAYDKNYKASLKSLEEAAELGLDIKSMVENDDAFSGLKSDKRYNELLKILTKD